MGWRFLIFLSEYAPLLLSFMASIVAYLLNLRLEDASAAKGSRLRAFLKRWVEYRVSKEKKSRFAKELILTITILAAFAFAPSIRFIFAYVGNAWNELVSKYPTGLVKFGAVACLIILSFVLFRVRRKFRRVYAFLEIAVGIVMAWDALSFVDTATLSIDMTGKLFSSDGLKLLAAIYVIIRGLVNWDERPKSTSANGREPQELNNTLPESSPPVVQEAVD